MPTPRITQHCLLAAATLAAAGIYATPASADPLPECPISFSTNDKPACQLTSADPLYLQFENRITGNTAQIRVIAADGVPLQTLTEHIDGSTGSGVLMLRDLDGDGRDELLLSLDTGGAHPNSHWTLWHATTDSPQLAAVPAPDLDDDVMHDSGTLFGLDFWHAGDGFVAEYGVGPMRSWQTRIYRFDAGQLTPVASVQNDGLRTDGSLPACRLNTDYELARFGLSPDAARDRFCANTEQRHAR